MKKKVAIIGSGVAGLTLANLLKTDSNFEFVVYEKENTLNLEEGFGIQLSTNGVFVLNKFGFDKIKKNQRYHPSKLDFYSINYDKICDLNLASFNSESTKYTTLKRSVLINFLKDSLFSNSIMFRKKINNVHENEGKVNIHFTDGSTDTTDYLVVSDGIFSNTKSVIEKKTFKPKYYGAVAIRGKVDTKDIPYLDSNNISLIMGANTHLVLYPINQKKEMNLICLVRKKLDDNSPIKITLENTILKENKSLIKLFKADLQSWPIYTSDKPIKSYYKNIFYIGDAFYAFLPTLAQGASQSIEAANEIFELITGNSKNIENEYFKNRLNRTNLIIKRSKINYFGFHLTNPLLKTFRNFFLKRLVKNKSFIQSYLGKVYK